MPVAIEQLDGDEFTTVLLGDASAVRIFVSEGPGEVTGLPVEGSGHPEEEGLILSQIVRASFDGSVNKVFTLTYNPIEISTEEEETAAFEDLPRREEYGGEFLKLPTKILSTGDKWIWDSTPLIQLDDNIDLIKIVPTGQIVITKIYRSLAPLRPLMQAARGKVNDQPFEEHDAGVLLYMGGSAEQFISSVNVGVKKFKVQHVFSVRQPTGIVGPNNDGWQFTWRGPDQGPGATGWDRPKSPNGKFLYETSNFILLFA